jgi:hypothetical protein
MATSGSTERQQKKRREILSQLGDRCAHRGIEDARVLQIDHVYGDGQQELRGGQGGGLAYYYRVLDDLKWSKLAGVGSNYQLLCANCNWIKRFENKEARGMLQHRSKSS